MKNILKSNILKAKQFRLFTILSLVFGFLIILVCGITLEKFKYYDLLMSLLSIGVCILFLSNGFIWISKLNKCKCPHCNAGTGIFRDDTYTKAVLNAGKEFSCPYCHNKIDVIE